MPADNHLNRLAIPARRLSVISRRARLEEVQRVKRSPQKTKENEVYLQHERNDVKREMMDGMSTTSIMRWLDEAIEETEVKAEIGVGGRTCD